MRIEWKRTFAVLPAVRSPEGVVMGVGVIETACFPATAPTQANPTAGIRMNVNVDPEEPPECVHIFTPVVLRASPETLALTLYSDTTFPPSRQPFAVPSCTPTGVSTGKSTPIQRTPTFPDSDGVADKADSVRIEAPILKHVAERLRACPVWCHHVREDYLLECCPGDSVGPELVGDIARLCVAVREIERDDVPSVQGGCQQGVPCALCSQCRQQSLGCALPQQPPPLQVPPSPAPSSRQMVLHLVCGLLRLVVGGSQAM